MTTLRQLALATDFGPKPVSQDKCGRGMGVNPELRWPARRFTGLDRGLEPDDKKNQFDGVEHGEAHRTKG